MRNLLQAGLVICLGIVLSIPAFAQQFKVSYSGNGTSESFSGNVFLYLSKENREPKGGYVGLTSFPCYRIHVNNIKPGQAVLFNDAAVSYPVSLSDIERGEYYVQAVWDKNTGDHTISQTIGNYFNKPMQVSLTRKPGAVFEIRCTEVVRENNFEETEYTKEIKLPSALLSGFHGKPVTINVAVLLPAAYVKEPERKFPVIYYVLGFGGDYRRVSGKKTPDVFADTVPFIRVFLDGNCPTGHSVYANSKNNGPWGDALVKELIPEVEKRFRCDGARLLTGHSSGGWTVLWLQTQYPSVFAGTWSSAPDPVDFRNFTGVNLYEDQNLFYAKDNELRMVASVAGRFPWVSMKQMYQMEHVMNRGEQMCSFEAVFSDRGKDGRPMSICDAATGKINQQTFEHWKQYDICQYLLKNWASVKPQLDGKIRISTGEQDNFFLNYAVHLLDDEMKKLGAGLSFGYYPGDHFTVFTKEYLDDGIKFLLQRYAAFKEQQK